MHDVTSLAERTISSFPLSIGTSLIFESLFPPRLDPYDAGREIPNEINIGNYQECWINIYTLLRNMSGAVNSKQLLTIEPEDFSATLELEIDLIHSLFTNEGNSLCKPIFYFCTYDEVYLKQKSIITVLRTEKTDIQKALKFKLMKAIQLFFKSNTNIVREYDSVIKPDKRTDALIITHFPYDLLVYRKFNSLSLLESHTGVLKPRNLWYTKYHKSVGADMSILPFEKMLLKVFGDSSMFSPADPKVRRHLLEVAVESKWTPMTTLEKIKLDIDIRIADPYLKFQLNLL